MKNIIQYILLLVITGSIISCSNSNNTKAEEHTTNDFNELEKASWLIGEWGNNISGRNTMESWEKINDSTFSGKGCVIIGSDTVSSETFSLEQHGKEVFYMPTVRGQNNGLPVKFTLTSSTGKQLIFENAQHDFPQKVSYTQITNDSLLAEISGIVEGKLHSQQFPMTRIK